MTRRTLFFALLVLAILAVIYLLLIPSPDSPNGDASPIDSHATEPSTGAGSTSPERPETAPIADDSPHQTTLAPYGGYDILTDSPVATTYRLIQAEGVDGTLLIVEAEGYACSLLYLDTNCEPAVSLDESVLTSLRAAAWPDKDEDEQPIWVQTALNLLRDSDEQRLLPMYPLQEISCRVVETQTQTELNHAAIRTQITGLTTNLIRPLRHAILNNDSSEDSNWRTTWLPGLVVEVTRVNQPNGVYGFTVDSWDLRETAYGVHLDVLATATEYFRVTVLDAHGAPIPDAHVSIISTTEEGWAANFGTEIADDTGQVVFFPASHAWSSRHWDYGDAPRWVDVGDTIQWMCSARGFESATLSAPKSVIDHVVHLQPAPVQVRLQFRLGNVPPSYTDTATLNMVYSYRIPERDAQQGSRWEDTVALPDTSFVDLPATPGDHIGIDIELEVGTATPHHLEIDVLDANEPIVITIVAAAVIRLRPYFLETFSGTPPTRYHMRQCVRDVVAEDLGNRPYGGAINASSELDDEGCLEARRLPCGEYRGIVWSTENRGGSDLHGSWSRTITVADIGSELVIPVLMHQPDDTTRVRVTYHGTPLRDVGLCPVVVPIYLLLEAVPRETYLPPVPQSVAPAFYPDADGFVPVPTALWEGIPAFSWAAWHPTAGYLRGSRKTANELELSVPPGFCSLTVEIDELPDYPLSVLRWGITAVSRPEATAPYWASTKIPPNEAGGFTIESLPPGYYAVMLGREMEYEDGRIPFLRCTWPSVGGAISTVVTIEPGMNTIVRMTPPTETGD